MAFAWVKWPIAENGGEGGLTARGGPAVLVLATPVPLAAADGIAAGTVQLHAGQVLRFALQWAPLSDPAPRPWDQAEIGDQLAATIATWRGWSAVHQSYQGPWRELVHHSGRVLQGLTYQPTGAIVPPPPPRCRRRSAENATGTTATPGSATPRSPWTPCGWRHARTRRTGSSLHDHGSAGGREYDVDLDSDLMKLAAGGSTSTG